MPSQSRQLAAIMFTDIVGYTALMGEDEGKAMQLLRKNRNLHKSTIKKHHGTWLKEMGDGTLASFTTTSDSVYCAGELMDACKSEGITLRIGIHQGEVTLEDGDIFGDGVNVASRIEPLAKPGQIMVSAPIHQNIKNKSGIISSFIKEAELKNVEDPIKLYSIEVKSTEPYKTTSKIEEDVSIADNSIAVLPFVNMSNDPEQEFFCDGISEEIINTIVQYPNLKVSGRTSSFSFKGKNEDLRVIGKALGVSKILEGSIRKMGNRIRITVQLVESSAGFHIWSKQYDRQLDDVFAIQDEIAKEIGNQLNLTLSKGSEKLDVRQQTQNLEAYELYLKGRILFYKRGPALQEALDCFKNALAIDENYALASAGLADTYTMLILHGYLPARENWKYAVEASDSAQKNGPELAETYNSLAIISMFYEWKWDQAEDQFKKAISINPSFIQAYAWYGLFFQNFVKGNLKAGIDLMKKALNIDPLSAYTRSCLCHTYALSGLYKEAIIEGEYVLKLDPTNNVGSINLITAYLWSGNYEKAYAFPSLEDATKRSGNMWLYSLVLIYLKMNQKKKAEQIYFNIEQKYNDNGLLPTSFAIVSAAFGNNEKAIELLNVASEVKDPALIFLALNHKDGKILHSLPGYNEIRKRMGLNGVYSNR
jgi:adenylate cyclase